MLDTPTASIKLDCCLWIRWMPLQNRDAQGRCCCRVATQLPRDIAKYLFENIVDIIERLKTHSVVHRAADNLRERLAEYSLIKLVARPPHYSVVYPAAHVVQ